VRIKRLEPGGLEIRRLTDWKHGMPELREFVNLCHCAKYSYSECRSAVTDPDSVIIS
jgi:hypothetical protein